ncbi:MAG: hypothetical protein HKN04_15060, partial [Rhodothermaceae bacterium]|nr:hypothetical protein [Rhodothermaceae bacterium]
MKRPGTVFWKVALVLVGVQVATALLAVGLSAYFAQERSLELVRGSLVLRLDQVAEEIESQATFDEETGALTLSRRLRLDLATRFPDPTYLLDDEGEATEILDEGEAIGVAPVRVIPPGAYDALAEGRLMV